MTLQTSGIISLADIHVEAEGSIYAGTSISSLNDANIRGLTPASGRYINPTLGTTVSFSDFYGASAISYIDTQSVTVEYQAAGQYNAEQWGYDGYIWYIGSISDGTCNWLSGNEYRSLSYTGSSLSLTVEGTNVNSGFTSMIIKGTTYTRSSATYSWSGTSGGRAWRWTTTNPFPTDGEVVTVQFT
jgi:hypothetical protein